MCFAALELYFTDQSISIHVMELLCPNDSFSPIIVNKYPLSNHKLGCIFEVILYLLAHDYILVQLRLESNYPESSNILARLYYSGLATLALEQSILMS